MSKIRLINVPLLLDEVSLFLIILRNVFARQMVVNEPRPPLVFSSIAKLSNVCQHLSKAFEDSSNLHTIDPKDLTAAHLTGLQILNLRYVKIFHKSYKHT